MNKAELFIDCKNKLGEGITWDHDNQTLYWLDIPMPSKLYKHSLETNHTFQFDMPEMITAMAIRPNNDVLIASHHGINNFNTTNKKFSNILDLEPEKPYNRCNDGAADFLGNFWVGTMQNNIASDGSEIEITKNSGSIYSIDKDLKVTNHVNDIGISNTFAWSPSNDKFYFTDTLTGIIDVYDYNHKDNKITNKREFVKFDRGYPDGSTVDSEGFLWSCRWSGSCVARFDPNGKLDTVIELPVPNVTSCTFGGSDLKTLFITTARMGMTEEELNNNPHAGSVFAYNASTKGKPDFKFGS